MNDSFIISKPSSDSIQLSLTWLLDKALSCHRRALASLNKSHGDFGKNEDLLRIKRLIKEDADLLRNILKEVTTATPQINGILHNDLRFEKSHNNSNYQDHSTSTITNQSSSYWNFLDSDGDIDNIRLKPRVCKILSMGRLYLLACGQIFNCYVEKNKFFNDKSSSNNNNGNLVIEGPPKLYENFYYFYPVPGTRVDPELSEYSTRKPGDRVFHSFTFTTKPKTDTNFAGNLSRKWPDLLNRMAANDLACRSPPRMIPPDPLLLLDDDVKHKLIQSEGTFDLGCHLNLIQDLMSYRINILCNNNNGSKLPDEGEITNSSYIQMPLLQLFDVIMNEDDDEMSLHERDKCETPVPYDKSIEVQLMFCVNKICSRVETYLKSKSKDTESLTNFNAKLLEIIANILSNPENQAGIIFTTLNNDILFDIKDGTSLAGLLYFFFQDTFDLTAALTDVDFIGTWLAVKTFVTNILPTLEPIYGDPSPPQELGPSPQYRHGVTLLLCIDYLIKFYKSQAVSSLDNNCQSLNCTDVDSGEMNQEFYYECSLLFLTELLHTLFIICLEEIEREKKEFDVMEDDHHRYELPINPEEEEILEIPDVRLRMEARRRQLKAVTGRSNFNQMQHNQMQQYPPSTNISYNRTYSKNVNLPFMGSKNPVIQSNILYPTTTLTNLNNNNGDLLYGTTTGAVSYTSFSRISLSSSTSSSSTAAAIGLRGGGGAPPGMPRFTTQSNPSSYPNNYNNNQEQDYCDYVYNKPPYENTKSFPPQPRTLLNHQKHFPDLNNNNINYNNYNNNSLAVNNNNNDNNNNNYNIAPRYNVSFHPPSYQNFTLQQQQYHHQTYDSNSCFDVGGNYPFYQPPQAYNPAAATAFPAVPLNNVHPRWNNNNNNNNNNFYQQYHPSAFPAQHGDPYFLPHSTSLYYHHQAAPAPRFRGVGPPPPPPIHDTQNSSNYYLNNNNHHQLCYENFVIAPPPPPPPSYPQISISNNNNNNTFYDHNHHLINTFNTNVPPVRARSTTFLMGGPAVDTGSGGSGGSSSGFVLAPGPIRSNSSLSSSFTRRHRRRSVRGGDLDIDNTTTLYEEEGADASPGSSIMINNSNFEGLQISHNSHQSQNTPNNKVRSRDPLVSNLRGRIASLKLEDDPEDFSPQTTKSSSRDLNNHLNDSNIRNGPDGSLLPLNYSKSPSLPPYFPIPRQDATQGLYASVHSNSSSKHFENASNNFLDYNDTSSTSNRENQSLPPDFQGEKTSPLNSADQQNNSITIAGNDSSITANHNGDNSLNVSSTNTSNRHLLTTTNTPPSICYTLNPLSPPPPSNRYSSLPPKPRNNNHHSSLYKKGRMAPITTAEWPDSPEPLTEIERKHGGSGGSQFFSQLNLNRSRLNLAKSMASLCNVNTTSAEHVICNEDEDNNDDWHCRSPKLRSVSNSKLSLLQHHSSRRQSITPSPNSSNKAANDGTEICNYPYNDFYCDEDEQNSLSNTLNSGSVKDPEETEEHVKKRKEEFIASVLKRKAEREKSKAQKETRETGKREKLMKEQMEKERKKEEEKLKKQIILNEYLERKNAVPDPGAFNKSFTNTCRRGSHDIPDPPIPHSTSNDDNWADKQLEGVGKIVKSPTICAIPSEPRIRSCLKYKNITTTRNRNELTAKESTQHVSQQQPQQAYNNCSKSFKSVKSLKTTNQVAKKSILSKQLYEKFMANTLTNGGPDGVMIPQQPVQFSSSKFLKRPLSSAKSHYSLREIQEEIPMDDDQVTNKPSPPHKQTKEVKTFPPTNKISLLSTSLYGKNEFAIQPCRHSKCCTSSAQMIEQLNHRFFQTDQDQKSTNGLSNNNSRYNSKESVLTSRSNITYPVNGQKIKSIASNNHSSSQHSLASTNSSVTRLYSKLSERSNKNLIIQALQYCVLAGLANAELRSKVSEILDKSDDYKQFIVLFRDRQMQYRGIYGRMGFEGTHLTKLHGIGPKTIMAGDGLIEFFYKYNCGSKSFSQIPSKHLSATIDGIVLKEICWQNVKPLKK